MHAGSRLRSSVLVTLGLLPAAGTGSVFAGAWTLPAGTGQIILGGDWIRNDPSAFGQSLNPNTQRSIKREIRAYGEYGVTDWLTAVLQPEFVNQHLDAPNRAAYTGLGYSGFGLRTRVLKTERWIVSFEGRLDAPGPSDRPGTLPNPAQIGNTGPRYDGRINAGYAFELFSKPSFIDVSAGYRIRTGRPPNETRADLTFGVRPAADWLVLIQSFNSISDGSGATGFPDQASSKLQISVVYDWSKRWSVQLGVLQTIASRRVGTETGAIGAVWYRF